MTTTPGPRTEAGKRLASVIDNYVLGNGAEFVAQVEAEARADVDGLVARLQSIANIAHLAWLDPATVPEAFQRIEALAEDKAEAPLTGYDSEAPFGRTFGVPTDELQWSGDKAEAPE